MPCRLSLDANLQEKNQLHQRTFAFWKCTNRKKNTLEYVDWFNEKKKIRQMRPAGLIAAVQECKAKTNTDTEAHAADLTAEAGAWSWVSVGPPQTQPSVVKHYGTRAASRSLCVLLFGLELWRPNRETRRGLSCLCQRRRVDETLVCWSLVALKRFRWIALTTKSLARRRRNAINKAL